MIAVYARVSTEESAMKGYSIQNQIDEGIKKAGTRDVLKYLDEGFSGEYLERPGIQKLREDVRSGKITKVIIYDPDRLSRNLMNALIIDDELRKQGIEVQYVNGEYADTAEGKLFFTLRGAVAEFEKAKIKERTMSGRKSKAKSGKVVKNDHVYGYNYDKEKGMLVINEEEAKVVRLIFEYFINPNSPFKGMNGIANHLTEMKIPTKKGKGVWHRQVVRQILMNQTYAGKKIQNRWDTEGMLGNKYKEEKIAIKVRPEDEWIVTEVPSIVTKEQYDVAQELLSVSRRRFSKASKNQYLLSGLLRCGGCGNTMTGHTTKNWGKVVVNYTDVKNTAGAKRKGCPQVIRAQDLDEPIWNAIVQYIHNPELVNEYEEEPTNKFSFEKQELERIEKEIEKARRGRKRLFSLVTISEDDLDLEEIKEQIRGLQQAENELIIHKEKIKKQIDESADNGLPNQFALKQALDLYFSRKDRDLSFDDKQQILRMLVKEIIVYDKDNIEVRFL
ncbi:recombinase family protein [Sutcliffiella horikoshii]|uniref:recombinase family protein n=1 Tax=Sutcliffiella horikoshii TaxID=79883 RepID=UPI00203C46D4|nr:recombinase family protein [Sutcliffiella horikoshii]MCM3619147.1 recombinase family protein [Sutcliffiella horikoshii]